MTRFIWLGLFCLGLLSACQVDTHVAPVTEGWQQPRHVQGDHVVSRGETLYSIAWRYGHDFRQLAAMNGIKAPYHLHVGQHLRLSVAGHKTRAQVVKVHKTPRTAHKLKMRAKKAAWTPPVNAKLQRVKHWRWPTRGRVVSHFGRNKKGIEIAGRVGQVIRAAAAGQVVYSGSGIRGFGKLIIIKHSDDYLSAYAFNQKLLVSAGKWIRSGQKIAEMGRNTYHRPRLHFEIRRIGRPVNPLRYLPRK